MDQAAYEVHIEVVTPDYRYLNIMRDSMKQVRRFGGIESAKAAIEAEADTWPQWSEARRRAFISHCHIVPARA